VYELQCWLRVSSGFDECDACDSDLPSGEVQHGWRDVMHKL
jgi:hypothetical protein